MKILPQWLMLVVMFVTLMPRSSAAECAPSADHELNVLQVFRAEDGAHRWPQELRL